MSTLTVTPTYQDNQILTEAQLDAVKTTIETHYNQTLIEGNNIQANILDASTKLASSAVTTAKLPSSAITTALLEDSTTTSNGITAAKIADSNVTTAKINDSAITTAKINDLDVTTDKIASNAVPKQIMLQTPISSATLTDSSTALNAANSTASPTLIGSVTATGLTVGKPLIVALQSTSTTTGSGYLGITFTISPGSTTFTFSTTFNVALYKDSTPIFTQQCQIGDFCNISAYGMGSTTTAYLRIPASSFVYVDNSISSSSHTYSLYIYQVQTPIYSFSGGNFYALDYTASPAYYTTSGTVSSIGIKLVTTQVV